MDHIESLKNFERRKDFFIGIDSDGCAFDNMDLKHKECFIPGIIMFFGLQRVSRFARQAGEFVTLNSRHRGINRFPLVVKIIDLLNDWDEPLTHGYKASNIDSLRKWVEEESCLGNPALEAKVAETNDPVLRCALEYSRAVDKTIAKMVRGIPPFPNCLRSLEKAHKLADIMVVSSAATEALNREWAECGIDRFVRMICGQEMGSKQEQLQYAACGKYDNDKILMIGDTPGDMKAAKVNNVLFYPINPGKEDDSWERFYDEGMKKFFTGAYMSQYQNALIEEFLAYLPDKPPWAHTET